MSVVPHPLLLPLRVVPDRLHVAVLARVLNRLLLGQSIAARLPELDGKTVSVLVADAPCRLSFRIIGSRLTAASGLQPDVTIRGTLRDFWMLAARREDPDTLFFERRLSIEGDTETGLHVKNLLDSLEFDVKAHFDAAFAELFDGTVGRLRSRLPS